MRFRGLSVTLVQTLSWQDGKPHSRYVSAGHSGVTLFLLTFRGNVFWRRPQTPENT